MNHDKAHNEALNAIQRRIDAIYSSALRELQKLAIHFDTPTDKPFSFSDYQQLKAQIDSLFQDFATKLDAEILHAYDTEEDRAEAKLIDICKPYDFDPVATTRTATREAFAKRRVQGLDLSQRVWNIKEGFYQEVETALDLALRDGTPADQLATELKQYLKHPDKLFRRVRDKHGQLHLSKRAKAFHPGQGVYRSSYKNARRLAVTEINIAYHTADHDRWKDLDFVLGYEIKVSGTNPNVCPICQELQGKYPKEFKWTGWHPHCRCHAIPILEKPENFVFRQKALRQGDRLPALGAIKELPKNFSTYLEANRPRIASSRSLPYFIRDNKSLLAYQLAPKEWRRSYSNSTKGGFVLTQQERYDKGQTNKQERKKFNKEQQMCHVLADNGFRVEHLKEIPRISSPDIRLNGKPAELKSVSSPMQIVKHAKKAVREQGAELVVFEFDISPSVELEKELDKIRRAGINGFYYYRKDGSVHKL